MQLFFFFFPGPCFFPENDVWLNRITFGQTWGGFLWVPCGMLKPWLNWPQIPQKDAHPVSTSTQPALLFNLLAVTIDFSCFSPVWCLCKSGWLLQFGVCQESKIHSLSCFPPTASEVLILELSMEICTLPKAISCPTNSSSVKLNEMAFYNINIMHIPDGQPCAILKLTHGWWILWVFGYRVACGDSDIWFVEEPGLSNLEAEIPLIQII